MFLFSSKLFLIISLCTYSNTYTILNRTIKKGNRLHCPLDKKVPFHPKFVVPYLFLFTVLIIGFLVTLFFLPIFEVQMVTFAFFIMLTSTYLFYIIYPTYIEPFITPKKDVFSKLVNLIYKHDKRFNAFPSLHVAISTLILLFVIGWNFWMGIILFPVILMIYASTVLIKQHYLPDIPAGVTIALLSYFFTAIFFT